MNKKFTYAQTQNPDTRMEYRSRSRAAPYCFPCSTFQKLRMSGILTNGHHLSSIVVSKSFCYKFIIKILIGTESELPKLATLTDTLTYAYRRRKTLSQR